MSNIAIIAAIATACFTFITACATSYRAYNSGRDLNLRARELNLKEASTRLHRLQVKKKLDSDELDELSEVDKYLE